MTDLKKSIYNISIMNKVSLRFSSFLFKDKKYIINKTTTYKIRWKKLFRGLHNNFPYYIDLYVTMETVTVPLKEKLTGLSHSIT